MDGPVLHHFHIHHFIGCLFCQNFLCFPNGNLLFLHLLGHHTGNHDGNLVCLLIIRLGRIAFVFHLDLNLPVIQFAASDSFHQFFAPLFFFLIFRLIGLLFTENNIHGASGLRLFRRPQNFGNAMQRFFLRVPAVAGGFLFLHKTHRFFHQVPHHGLYVSSHVTYFGVLGGFHLHKRCMGQGGNPPGNFCLAYAGGANEKNILGADFPGNIRWKLSCPPAVPKSHCHSPFGILLPDNVMVQVFYNLTGC